MASDSELWKVFEFGRKGGLLRICFEQTGGFGSHICGNRLVPMNAVGVEHQERSRRVPDSALQREFLALLDAHGGVLMGMLRRLCGNHHEAEDVFQETAVRVWRSFAGRPTLRSPRAWVMTIGYRAFLDVRGRQNRA